MQRPRPVIATGGGSSYSSPRLLSLAPSHWHRSCRKRSVERKHMGPAIALRLRQHLTLTPQVQQALRLLQMSALEFAQEMEQALTANPFLEENSDAPAAAPPATPFHEENRDARAAAARAEPVVERTESHIESDADLRAPQEPSAGGER